MRNTSSVSRVGRHRTSWPLLNDWLIDLSIRAVLWLLLRLPWKQRLGLAGSLASRCLEPVNGWRSRARENLALVMPHLIPEEVDRLSVEVLANIGRSFVEMYAPEEFVARVATEPLVGLGISELAEAHAQGRAVLLVTGHIGNYDAMRAALIARGYNVGGLYKPMANRYFNASYVATAERIGKPLFPKDNAGKRGMLQFLRKGGMLGLVLDQRAADGVPIMFMGIPAMTALSAAHMALKYDALLVPVYGIRRPDLGFDLIVNAPILHGDPVAMTQALNDDLAEQVRLHPEQWLWTHRRWRGIKTNAKGGGTLQQVTRKDDA